MNKPMLGLLMSSALLSVLVNLPTVQADTLANNGLLPNTPMYTDPTLEMGNLLSWPTATLHYNRQTGQFTWLMGSRNSYALTVLEQTGLGVNNVNPNSLWVPISPASYRIIQQSQDEAWSVKTLKALASNGAEQIGWVFPNSLLSIRVLQDFANARFNPDQLNEAGVHGVPDIPPGSVNYSQLQYGGLVINPQGKIVNPTSGRNVPPTLVSRGNTTNPSVNSMQIAQWEYPYGVPSHSAVLVDGNLSGPNATLNWEMAGVAVQLAEQVHGPLLATTNSTTVSTQLINTMKQLGIQTVWVLGSNDNATLTNLLTDNGLTVQPIGSPTNPSQTSWDIHQQFSVMGAGPQVNIVTAQNPNNIPINTVLAAISGDGDNTLLFEDNQSQVPVNSASFTQLYASNNNFFGNKAQLPTNMPNFDKSLLANPYVSVFPDTPSVNLWNMYQNTVVYPVPMTDVSKYRLSAVPFVFVNPSDPLALQDMLWMAPSEIVQPEQYVFLKNAPLNQQNPLDVALIIQHGEQGLSYNITQLGLSQDIPGSILSWAQKMITDTPNNVLENSYVTATEYNARRFTLSSVMNLTVTGLANNSTVSVNQPVQFQFSAIDPSDTPEYQVWVENPQGQWTVAQGYSPQNSWTWIPRQPGQYHVAFYALDPDQVALGQWNHAIEIAETLSVQ